MSRKKIKGKTGDIFAIPLKENRFCFGQIVAAFEWETWMILFDFASTEVPEIKSILDKPVLALANITLVAIEDGKWLIVGNAEVALKDLVLPNYLSCEIMGVYLIVRSFDDRILRYATEADFNELEFKTTVPSFAFEYLARHRFEGEPWDGFYDNILYNKKSTWRSPAKEFFLNQPMHEFIQQAGSQEGDCGAEKSVTVK